MEKKVLNDAEQEIKLMDLPELLDSSVLACAAVPAAQAAIALVPAVPTLCYWAAAAV